MSDRDKLEGQDTLVGGSFAGGRTREFQSGDVVGGNYRIKSVLGRGGMGVVYLAEHLVIHRDMALKALAPDRIDEANWIRFQAEGKAIARLDHPNIVKVYDMGTDGPDCLYYVMDLLRGVSLAQYNRENGLPNLAETLEIFGQLCSGLGYAHRHGLVHRDIKPSNIILCPAGGGSKVPVVKIIDYGLVKLVGEASQLAQSLTATGQVCGSPLYMSPEQCMEGNIDERSDIYSLGCTLYECLTGEPPFCGESALDTALMHQNKKPSALCNICPEKEYPEGVEQLINRMLQKNPAQRHQSMAQVNQDILRIKAGKSVMSEPVFFDGPVFQIDTRIEERLEAPHRKTALPLGWILALAAIATLFAVWAVASSISVRKETKDAGNVLRRTTEHPDTMIGRPETPEDAHAREVFTKCPQISNGIITRDGAMVRVFNFPEVPLGYICWGRENQCRQEAKGEVSVPAGNLVTLQLCRGAGDYARMFPSILAKIGPEDIYALEVREPANNIEGGDTISYELPGPLVQAIGKWTALRKIDFYHCKLSNETVLALNSFSAMDELKLRDGLVDGAALAQVKWLKGLTNLDIKGIKDVDPVLRALAGAPFLTQLGIELTMPSKGALKVLTSCNKLTALFLDDADMDDDKLVPICDIHNLRALSLSRCDISAKSVDNLAKLKRLSVLRLLRVRMGKEDVETLQQKLPQCAIKYEKIKKMRVGDL